MYGYNFKKHFFTIEDFKNEIFSGKYEKCYIFCHFAEFDLNGIFGNIKTGLDKEAIFNGSTFIMAQKDGVIFADSLNIYKSSVEKIGELIGYPKLKMDSKFGQGKRFKIKPEHIEYCFRDCEIVWNALDNLFCMVQSVRPTLASLSMIYFRRFYQKFDLAYNNHSIKFFNSYYGGRVEAFKLGKTNSYKYDINSMYPFIGSIAVFPNPKFVRVSDSKTVSGLLYDMKYYEGHAHIKVRHKETNFGYLPVKYNGKLIFPVGVFSGCWCFPEIRYALENGIIEILEVNEVLVSLPMKSPFEHFYKELYSKRQVSKNEIERTLLKLLMNSNYGKWGQREKHKDIYFEEIPFELITQMDLQGIPYELKMFNQKRNDCYLIIFNPSEAIKTKTGYKIKYSNGHETEINQFNVYTEKELKNLTQSPKIHTIPVFSSYITSLARVYLLSKMVENEKHGVTYVDTDCICLEKKPRIKDSKELGAFKLESDIITEIYGNKNYQQLENGINSTRKIKGVPKKAVKISKDNEKFANIVKSLPNDAEFYEFQNMTKTKTAIRNGKNAGVWNTVYKVIQNIYDKRIVNKDKTTKPIKLNQKKKIKPWKTKTTLH